MRVLIGCEMSGIVRDAFLSKGHDVWSCDVIPTLKPGPHIINDVRNILDWNWDLAVFFPPCTHLASSGARWFPQKRWEQKEALKFVRLLMNAPIPRIAIENPVGVISTAIRKPDQIIQPWQFGEDASKKTCLWLKNLPPLYPTKMVFKERYANQTPSGQNNLPPSEDRAMKRSLTYAGIANAMADQWLSAQATLWDFFFL